MATEQGNANMARVWQRCDEFSVSRTEDISDK